MAEVFTHIAAKFTSRVATTRETFLDYLRAVQALGKCPAALAIAAITLIDRCLFFRLPHSERCALASAIARLI
jgi:hypothetical protein